MKGILPQFYTKSLAAEFNDRAKGHIIRKGNASKGFFRGVLPFRQISECSIGF